MRIHRRSQHDSAASIQGGCQRSAIECLRRMPVFPASEPAPLCFRGRPGLIATEIDPLLTFATQLFAIEFAILPKHTFLADKSELHYSANPRDHNCLNNSVLQNVAIGPSMVVGLYDGYEWARGAWRLARRHAKENEPQHAGQDYHTPAEGREDRGSASKGIPGSCPLAPRYHLSSQ